MKSNEYKSLTKEQALEKLRHYCAYQDRCHSEVRTKLLKLEVYGDELEDIMTILIEEKFLNEVRFAQSYVRGKHRIKKWGKIKIKQGLSVKKVSAYCIKKGMAEIDQHDYIKTLTELLSKKKALLSESLKPAESYKKLQSFAINKGYEFEVIKLVLQSLGYN